LGNTARKALVWSLAERNVGLVIALVTTMILSRLLTPSQVGVYSLCAAFTAVAGILRDFGVSEYLIQEKELTRERMRAAYGLAIVVAWLIAVLIFSFREELAAFYAERQVSSVLAVLAINFLILPLSSPAFALMNRELAFRQIFWLQIACNSAQSVGSIAMALAGFGVMALAWGPVINVATQTLILVVLRPRQTLLLPSLRQSRHVLRFGSMYVGSRVLETVARNSHEPLLAKSYGFEAVGLFSRAFGLIEIFNATLSAAVVRVTTPAFAAASRAGHDVADAFGKATGMFVSISWTFFFFVALMAEPIIRIMFGTQWVAAAPIASILAIGALPASLNTMAPQMLSATGYVSLRLRLSLVFCVLHVLCIFVAASVSLYAVAWVWFVSMSFITGLYAFVLRRIFKRPVFAIYGPAVRGAVVAASAGMCQWGAAAAIGVLGWPAVVQVLCVAATAMLAWLAAARLLSDPALPQILELLTVIRGRKSDMERSR
jgi:O-antigen/teichoic acid export membrane protein